MVEAAINPGLAPEPIVPAAVTVTLAAPPSVANYTVFVPALYTLRVTVLLTPSTFTINATYALPWE